MSLPGPFARLIKASICLNARAQPTAQALACMADGVLLRHAHEASDEADKTWLRVVTPRGERAGRTLCT